MNGNLQPSYRVLTDFEQSRNRRMPTDIARPAGAATLHTRSSRAFLTKPPFVNYRFVANIDLESDRFWWNHQNVNQPLPPKFRERDHIRLIQSDVIAL